ncbi:MAG: PAS domain S-box protein, partial [bacterium]|nr:PAS domain S-box protein [bacterium]
IIDTNNFFIALFDKHTDTISLPYLKDEKDKFKTYPAGKTLTAYVINSGKALLANRTAIDQLVELGAIESVGTDCEVWLGCPLRIEEKIIGVVALQSYTDPNAYSCNDLEMLNFASEQIGLSIERKQTEDNLRSLTAMIEQSTDSIIQTDTDFRIIYINDAACKLFGWTFEEIKGKSPVVFYAPADHAKQDKENRPIQKNTVALSPGESIYRKKDGSLFCGQFKVSPLTDQNGNIYGYMGIIQDISQRKKSQEDRVQLEEQLLHAQKMEAVGNLAGGIAHDFNNILGVIMGYTQLTVDNISDVPRAQYNLEKIMIAADRAKEVVKQVLTFSRKEEKDLRPLYIANVLQETLSLLRASLPATIEIRREIRKGLKPVMANFTQIHQVVMNICTNAAHAMKENGGVLAIDLKEAILDDRTVAGKELEPGKYQQLTFSDTGNGMLPVVMRRIFEPYYTTKKKGEGTGLGLAVVHGIVKSHGGDISVESEPGKGTVFHLFLPETEDEWVTKKKSPGTIPGGNERILLVDDEILLVDMESHMLSRLGYRVAAHTGSHEALEDFRNHPHQFDLVITDQTMPNMTGLQLSSQLKRIRSDIPIILCTGFSEVINEKNFKTRGIDGFIMKPILKKKLAQLIRSLLDART